MTCRDYMCASRSTITDAVNAYTEWDETTITSDNVDNLVMYCAIYPVARETRARIVNGCIAFVAEAEHIIAECDDADAFPFALYRELADPSIRFLAQMVSYKSTLHTLSNCEVYLELLVFAAATGKYDIMKELVEDVYINVILLHECNFTEVMLIASCIVFPEAVLERLTTSEVDPEYMKLAVEVYKTQNKKLNRRHKPKNPVYINPYPYPYDVTRPATYSDKALDFGNPDPYPYRRCDLGGFYDLESYEDRSYEEVSSRESPLSQYQTNYTMDAHWYDKLTFGDTTVTNDTPDIIDITEIAPEFEVYEDTTEYVLTETYFTHDYTTDADITITETVNETINEIVNE